MWHATDWGMQRTLISRIEPVLSCPVAIPIAGDAALQFGTPVPVARRCFNGDGFATAAESHVPYPNKQAGVYICIRHGNPLT